MKASHSQVRIIIRSDTEFVSISDEEVRVMKNCASRGLFCVSVLYLFSITHSETLSMKVFFSERFILEIVLN